MVRAYCAKWGFPPIFTLVTRLLVVVSKARRREDFGCYLSNNLAAGLGPHLLLAYRMLALLCALWFPTWESAKSDASSEFPMQKYPGMSVDPAMNVIINVSCVSPNPLHFALIASWLSMEAKIEKVLLATPARQKYIVPIPMYYEYRWHSRRQNLPPTQEGPSRNRRWAVDRGS